MDSEAVFREAKTTAGALAGVLADAKLANAKRQEERERRARRDMFAAAALTGILAARKTVAPDHNSAALAVLYADEIIRELNKDDG